MALRGMKIGILGGSFNPPHEGHRHISLVALKRLWLDRIWWIVTPGNPLKSHVDLAPLNKRMEMCRVTSNHPRIDVTDFEQARGSSYTYETLNYLSTRYGDVKFTWLMGADSLVNFHHWKKWRDLAGLISMAVIDRPGFRLKAMSSRFALSNQFRRLKESNAANLSNSVPNSWAFITAKQLNISSTNIRKML